MALPAALANIWFAIKSILTIVVVMLNPSKELTGLKQTMHKFYSGSDFSMAEEAFWISYKYHEKQKRDSGEQYFTHPLRIAKTLAGKGMDEKIVSAALLHDTLEDTDLKPEELRKELGEEVCSIVEGLTKLDKEAFKSRQEHSAANIIKTIIASSDDIRVILIKLYDKLDNMQTIRHLPKEKQKRIASDCLAVYVPLSHMLGIHELKRQLEDLCFETLEPGKKTQAEREIKMHRKTKIAEINKIVSAIKRHFPKDKITPGIESKSAYGIYSKMIEQNKKIPKIPDIAILNLTVNNSEECYKTLGKIHSLFKPIPNKIKDYIALPENYIYRGLHTQVMGPSKRPVKIYIYSREMEDVAENGIIAYLRDEKANMERIAAYTQAFSRLSKPYISKKENGNSEVTFESYTITVFTENGETINLPIGSTALDFSFFENEKKAVYSSKSEINGKIEPLWAKLHTGDRVRIYYTKSNQLRPAWKSFANTAKAKNSIEKKLIKDQKYNSGSKLVKISIEYLDRPGIISKQMAIMAKYELDMEIIRGMCKSDKTTCYTDYYFRKTGQENVEKTIKEIKELPETLDINVDYYQ